MYREFTFFEEGKTKWQKNKTTTTTTHHTASQDCSDKTGSIHQEHDKTKWHSNTWRPQCGLQTARWDSRLWAGHSGKRLRLLLLMWSLMKRCQQPTRSPSCDVARLRSTLMCRLRRTTQPSLIDNDLSRLRFQHMTPWKTATREYLYPNSYQRRIPVYCNPGLISSVLNGDVRQVVGRKDYRHIKSWIFWGISDPHFISQHSIQWMLRFFPNEISTWIKDSVVKMYAPHTGCTPADSGLIIKGLW